MTLTLTDTEKKAVAKLMPRSYKKFYPACKIIMVAKNTVYTEITTQYGETKDQVSVIGIYDAVIAIRREAAFKLLGIK